MSDPDLESVIITKYVCDLRSQDRKIRKRAVDELLKLILEDETQVLTKFALVEKEIWKLFFDPSEAVRDSAVNLIEKTFQKVELNENYLLEFIPILISRVTEKENTEPSEEIRLRLIILLNQIIVNDAGFSGTYAEDIVAVLGNTLADPYPKIRKESCECVSNFAKLHARHFYNHSVKVIKPLLTSFSHQHYKLRISAIEAVGNVLKYGNNKNLPVQEVFGSLAERLFDSTMLVRKAVTLVVADLLVNLPDRYSFFTKLIPLILTSLCDESDELREEAWKLWCKAGEQYVDENDEELKDKSQFLYQKPEHYPKNVERPNLGCRTLVQRNTCQIVSALSKELEDWKNDIRIKSAQLLCWVVLHDETNITQHTEDLLLVMYKICNQKDLRIVDNVEKAAEYIAYFVPPESYLKLVLPILEDVCTQGHLCVLSALLRGSEGKLLQPHLQTIAEFLAADSITHNRDSVYLMQLMKCCEAILDVSCEDCEVIDKYLFTIIITGMAVTSHQQIIDTGQELLEKMYKVLRVDGVEDVYKAHTGLILDKIEASVESWTPVSYERFILQVLMVEAGRVLGLHLKQFGRILVTAMKPDSDANIRLKLFTLLSDLMLHGGIRLEWADPEEFNGFLLTLTLDVITPNLVWHAGRTAEALRTAAVGCLCTTLIKPNSEVQCNLHFAQSQVLEKVFNTLLPLLINAVEDTIDKTRLFALKTLNALVPLLQDRGIFTPDHVSQIYPVILKRLDDVSDEVRLSTLSSIKIVYQNLPEAYSIELYKSHLQQVYAAMLIHLDDDDEEFSQQMRDTLKIVGKIAPELLAEKLISMKNKFRKKTECDEIIEYLQDLNVK